MYATCANLLNYPDSSGHQGTELRPEIAAAMPAVSADGRTYSFNIRRGFRFSPPSNEEVTAQTFRHTIERALSAKNIWSEGPRLASDIAGVSAYRAGQSGAHLRPRRPRIRVLDHADEAGGRLPDPDLDARLLPGSPVGPSPRKRAVADADPVCWAVLHLLVRGTPNRARAKPQLFRRAGRGMPSESSTETTPRPHRPLRSRTPARSTYFRRTSTTRIRCCCPVISSTGSTVRTSIAARAGRQRYFSYHAPLVDYIVFNTRRPLFRSVLLRRAVNYALDRRALAAAYDDAPADQIVPPAVPGFPAGHVYPVAGPDLATARRLAGGDRRSAVLYICGDPRLPNLARIVSSNLAAIRIGVRILRSDQCPTSETRTGDRKANEADLVLAASSTLPSEERDPAPFLEGALSRSLFGSKPPPGPWNEPSFRTRLRNAHPCVGTPARESLSPPRRRTHADGSVRRLRQLGLVPVRLTEAGLQALPGGVRLPGSRRPLQESLVTERPGVTGAALGRSESPRTGASVHEQHRRPHVAHKRTPRLP